MPTWEAKIHILHTADEQGIHLVTVVALVGTCSGSTVREGAEELELESGRPVIFSGGSSLEFVGSAKFRCVVYTSVASEGLAPYMRQLGFPLRADSASEAKPSVAGSGFLSDQDLTTYGFERRVLNRLTEECKDFGAIYRCK